MNDTWTRPTLKAAIEHARERMAYTPPDNRDLGPRDVYAIVKVVAIVRKKKPIAPTTAIEVRYL